MAETPTIQQCRSEDAATVFAVQSLDLRPRDEEKGAEASDLQAEIRKLRSEIEGLDIDHNEKEELRSRIDGLRSCADPKLALKILTEIKAEIQHQREEARVEQTRKQTASVERAASAERSARNTASAATAAETPRNPFTTRRNNESGSEEKISAHTRPHTLPAEERAAIYGTASREDEEERAESTSQRRSRSRAPIRQTLDEAAEDMGAVRRAARADGTYGGVRRESQRTARRIARNVGLDEDGEAVVESVVRNTGSAARIGNRAVATAQQRGTAAGAAQFAREGGDAAKRNIADIGHEAAASSLMDRFNREASATEKATFDLNGTGRVTFNEFDRVRREFDLSWQQMNAFNDDWGLDLTISYEDLRAASRAINRFLGITNAQLSGLQRDFGNTVFNRGGGEMTLNDIRYVFNQRGITTAELDANRDGRITEAEIRSRMNRALGRPPAPANVAARAPRNNSEYSDDIQRELANLDRLRWDELRQRNGTATFNRNGGTMTVADIQAAFTNSGVRIASFDANNDGNITGAELTRAMASVRDRTHSSIPPRTS
jgi:hypothetical protein